MFGKRFRFDAVLLAVFVVSTSNVWAQDQRVKNKEKEVPKNGNIDIADEELTVPVDLTTVGEKLNITTRTFKPPTDEWKFKSYGTTHVDIVVPTGAAGTAVPDTDSAIKVAAIAIPKNAGQFPLRAEGNLEPPKKGGGGGGGGPAPKAEVWHWSVRALATSCSIEPEDGQRGVIGDLVPSNMGNTGERHFVTPQAAGKFVELKAVLQDGAGPFEDHFKWSPAPAAGSDVQPVEGKPDHVKVKREAAKKIVIRVLRETDFSIACRLNVWVVWSTIAETRQSNATVIHARVTPKVGEKQPGTAVQATWQFVATIQPASIVDTTADIPNLAGDASAAVPNGHKKHILTGDKLAGGAKLKWDISRQVRVRIKSPTVGTNSFASPGGAIFDGLPAANKVVENFPESDVEGNDDAGTSDEDNDPYTSAVGHLLNVDPVSIPVVIDAAGAVDDVIEVHAQFVEFVRLEIGSTWYRISASDDGVLRHLGKIKKAGGTWVDDGSTGETNHDDWE
jgi:hypothetical protein